MKMRMKKMLCMALAMGVMAMPLSGCGSKSESGKEAAAEGKVLRVGMECAYAPFNWTQVTEDVPDGSKAVPIYGSSDYAYGYDVMVAQKLADQMGMSLEIHKVEWDSIGLSLDANEYDCIIAGMGRTAEREASYSFTEPYYYRDNCLVVKKGSEYESAKGLSDFKGKNVTVTTQLGTGWVPLLEQIPDANLGANYETTAEVFMAISNGVADVALIDLPTAESALLTNTDLTIIVPDENDAFEGDKEMTNVCIATRKDDTALRDKIQKAMDDIGWNDKAKMDELMGKAVELQPAAN
ncbi:transporter substrate-binding domain-containing protein [Ruminococcus sp.]|uniref:transporter substrate-binding domain-containing protein n=1 Tax=Ruminococcus sp. TaxID=41978 RepID=UPI0025EA7C15|nr:transporter substrate-binding domain-containing protein [Ruminococcus sp.]